MNKIKHTVVFGGVTYLYGFKTTGYWVTDMKDNNVAECCSIEVAKALAKELNKLFEHGVELK
jgi:hypothetical protein